METASAQRLIVLLAALLLALLPLSGALADDYTAQSMRLLHYEGEVEILDSNGKPRFVMENARFKSGEAMRTGEASTASVSLDATKIVTIDQLSRLEFVKQGNHMLLTLKEGTMLLDVQEKLDENESLDVETSTLTVGIRGTMIVLSEQSKEDLTVSKLSVLSGKTQVTFVDESGARQSFQLSSGSTAILTDKNGNGHTDAPPVIRKTEKEDMEGFVDDQLRKNPEALKRLEDEARRPDDTNQESGKEDNYPYPASGKWQWNGKVSLVAQSASKMYDGTPLVRASGVLVEGLPAEFRCSVSATGVRTDAGRSANPVGDYRIYNSRNEDVTSHFPNVEKIDGQLIVEPVPITVITGSAEKVYDGTPLINPEANIAIRRSVESESVPEGETAAGGVVGGTGALATATRNISYLVDPSLKNQTLYGVCGVVVVHAMNPLTGEASDVQLKAGYKLIIFLNDEEGQESLKYETEPVALADLPDEMLRIYAENPDALKQACQETGWKEEDVKACIANLKKDASARIVEQNGIRIVEDEADRLLADFTNAHINIDSSITNYNGRALNGQEAEFVTPPIDGEISVTATGSQTDVGESVNTYEIKWGNAKKENYVVAEALGTLTVTPATITVTTGTSEKVYDGQPLRNSQARISGLVNGETATVSATGSITRNGKTRNTYTIHWKTAKAENYTVHENLGSLVVEPLLLSVDFQGDEVEMVEENPVFPDPVLSYGNGPHAGETVTAVRTRSLNMAYRFSLFTGDQIGFEIKSKKKGGGYYDIIATPTYPSGLESSFSVEYAGTVFEGGPQKLTISTPSASKTYDGTPLTSANITVEGLDEDDIVQITVTGSQTEAGSSTNTYTIDWGDTNPEDYAIIEDLGTLTVEPLALTITTGTATKVFDGTPLTKDELSVNGTPLTKEDGAYQYSLVGTDYLAAMVTGTVTDVTAEPVNNTCVWEIGSGNAENYAVTVMPGTLQVTPRAVTLKLDGLNENIVYDGEYHGDGLTAESTGIAVTCTDRGEGYWDVTMPWGDVIEAVISGGGMDADDYMLGCDWSVTTGAASNYSISATGTNMKIKPARVVLVSSSGEKQYDGTPLTCYGLSSNYLCVQDAEDKSVFTVTLKNGETITVTVTGSQTDVGDGENTFTIFWGDTVSTNYNTETNYGVLKVTKNHTAITITAPSDHKTYDGMPLSVPTDNPGVEGLPSGFELYADKDYYAEQTDAGAAAVAVTGYEIWYGETNVTANFDNVETVSGYLTVTPMKLKVTAYGRYPYDGDPHYGATNVEVQVTEGWRELPITVVQGDEGKWTITLGYLDYSFTLTTRGGGTEINNYTLTCNVNSESNNYEITVDSSGGVAIVDPDAFTSLLMSKSMKMRGPARTNPPGGGN